MRKGIVGVAIVLAVVVAGFGLAIVSSSNDPDVARAAGLVRYDSCDALLDGLQAQALEQVGPYGLEEGGGVARLAEGDIVTDEFAPITGRIEESSAVGAEEQDAAAAPTTTAPASGGDADDSESSSAGSSTDDSDGETTTEFSETNVQEEGVDEPDVVKTDGERLITVVDGALRIFDVTGDAPVELGSVAIPGDDAYEGAGYELLLSGDTALVLGLTYRNPGPIGEPIPIEGEVDTFAEQVTVPEGTLTGDLTTLVEVDLSDPSSPEVVHTAEVEGGYTTARMVGDVARVVTSTYAPVLGFVYPSDGTPQSEEVAEQANRRLIEQSTLEQWLPQVVVDGGEAEQAVACEQVGLPEEPSGFGTATVVTVDLSDGLAIEPESAASVLGGSEVVYASAENLYVATTAWPSIEELEGLAEVDSSDDSIDGDDVVSSEPYISTTAIHRFALPGDGAAVYEASGEVEGRMLSQFSFSEHEGNLRVATTVDESAGSVSQLTVLAVDDLTEVGSVGDIGRGEELFAVRMLGDVGYAVTFEQTDPLFTIDLADPTNPVVVGELEIPGYSSYLHPISDELLLGIGQAGTADGVLTGTQVSLFDVSDPASPQRVQQYDVTGGSSEAEYDHRAFLYWPETGLAVLPISVYDYSAQVGGVFEGVLGLDVSEDAITEVGRIVNADPIVDCDGPTPVPDVPEDGEDAPAPPETTVPDETEPSTPTTSTVAPTTTVVPPEGEVEVEGTISEVPPPDDFEVACTGEPIRRSIVIGDRVLTVSGSVVQTSDLATLDPIASVTFAD